jgi:hypothetical protein
MKGLRTFEKLGVEERTAVPSAVRGRPQKAFIISEFWDSYFAPKDVQSKGCSRILWRV